MGKAMGKLVEFVEYIIGLAKTPKPQNPKTPFSELNIEYYGNYSWHYDEASLATFTAS